VEALGQVQDDMLARAVERRDANVAEAASLDEAIEAGRTGFARVPFALLADGGEDRLAAEAITVRCLQRPDGSLPESGDEPDLVAFVGRSY
ncbi:MAG TPA: proline--tRNA ligase, partial [Acidimicrobiales bacterium]